jgi:hypothetical protein
MQPTSHKDISIFRIIVLFIVSFSTVLPFMIDLRAFHAPDIRFTYKCIFLSAVLFDIGLFALHFAGAVLNITDLGLSQYTWLHMALLCSLQLQVSTNVNRPPDTCLQLLTFPKGLEILLHILHIRPKNHMESRILCGSHGGDCWSSCDLPGIVCSYTKSFLPDSADLS